MSEEATLPKRLLRAAAPIVLLLAMQAVFSHRLMPRTWLVASGAPDMRIADISP